MSEPQITSTWRVALASENQTAALAAQVASLVAPGDLVTLSGDLGSGKTTFARALIRHLCGDPELEAPSPSFTLISTALNLPASWLNWDGTRPLKARLCWWNGPTASETASTLTGSTLLLRSMPLAAIIIARLC